MSTTHADPTTGIEPAPAEPKSGGKIICNACPVLCNISEGRSGACDRYANVQGVLTRLDPLVLTARTLDEKGELVAFGGKPWDNIIDVASWVPIDHVPAPPAVVEFLRKPPVRPIAMSKFGQEMLAHDKVDATFIPHGIETKIFKPTARVSVGGKMMTGREIMGIDEDRFVVGAINANKGINPSRKSWGENLLAFSLFAQQHDDAVIYLHTERDGAMGGVKLPEIIKSLGLREDQYRFVNQYAYRMGIPDEGLAAIYTACDVGLMVSMGEGFGLTAAEMQACERPVIVSDFSAQPELLGDGWLVAGQPWWDAAQHGWFNQPIVGNIVEALEAAYARGRGMSAKARKHIVDNYDADKIYQTKWRPFLADLEASL
jgi:glycosyltransferase involved in cell wall biosynthesis